MSRPADRTAWILVLGCVLCALGLAKAQNPPTTQVFPSAPSIANADSNNRMIAVTGSDITGASILYLIDTVGMHIAVYQANGGSNSTQGITLVGARRIDLDLSLDGFNDKSKYTYKELKKEFRREGLNPPDSE